MDVRLYKTAVVYSEYILGLDFHYGKIQVTQPSPEEEHCAFFCKSCFSLGAISMQLKLPRAFVQTIFRKYKDLGTTKT